MWRARALHSTANRPCISNSFSIRCILWAIGNSITRQLTMYRQVDTRRNNTLHFSIRIFVRILEFILLQFFFWCAPVRSFIRGLRKAESAFSVNASFDLLLAHTHPPDLYHLLGNRKLEYVMYSCNAKTMHFICACLYALYSLNGVMFSVFLSHTQQ